MNREILFRGKRVDNNEWVYGYYIEVENKPYISRGKILHIRSCYSELDYTEQYEVIQETIGQYTGLTDKNGNKIFEGDILHDKYFSWEVYFDDGAFWRRWVYPDLEGDREEEYLGGTTEDLEVIGNIYDKEVEE